MTVSTTSSLSPLRLPSGARQAVDLGERSGSVLIGADRADVHGLCLDGMGKSELGDGQGVDAVIF